LSSLREKTSKRKDRKKQRLSQRTIILGDKLHNKRKIEIKKLNVSVYTVNARKDLVNATNVTLDGKANYVILGLKKIKSTERWEKIRQRKEYKEIIEWIERGFQKMILRII
jgi:hypothetical protein